MQKFGLVVDSTTFLDQELFEKMDIEVVSLSVTIDQDTYKEVDIDDEFVKSRLSSAKKMHSSAPSPGDFVVAYENLIAKGYKDIAVIPISTGLSSTHQSALMAIDILDRSDINIVVIDTLQSNVGLRTLIMTFVDEILAGMEFEQFIIEARVRVANTRLQFTVQDLKQLYNTGRLKILSLLAAEILRMKPIIEMVDGKLENVAKPITIRGVFDAFVNSIKTITDKGKNLFITVVSIRKNSLVEPLLEKFKEAFPYATFDHIEQINPVYVLSLGNKGIGFAATAY